MGCGHRSRPATVPGGSGLNNMHMEMLLILSPEEKETVTPGTQVELMKMTGMASLV